MAETKKNRLSLQAETAGKHVVMQKSNHYGGITTLCRNLLTPA